MGLQINTNVMALTAQQNLSANNTRLNKALERLSSGLRINRAADDAAGLAVSEKLRSQIKGLSQASRNAQDGISMIQTAEGSLAETHAILQRMRELAVQSGTDTLQDNDRINVQAEYTQLTTELNRIANVTNYNGIKLLNGSLTSTATVSGLGSNITAANGIDGISAGSSAAAGAYTITVANGSAAGRKLITVTDGTGNAQALDVAVPTSGSSAIDFAAVGITVDVNNALTNVNANNGFTVGVTTGSAQLLIGSGFNFSGGVFTGVDSVNEVLTVSISNMSATSLGVDALNLSTRAGAQSAIQALDTAIGTVSTTRATLGSYQNRLERTITSLGVTVENLSASESRIRDADVAEETTRMVSAQILSQAGTSVLSQANQAPQAALALLRGG